MLSIRMSPKIFSQHSAEGSLMFGVCVNIFRILMVAWLWKTCSPTHNVNANVKDTSSENYIASFFHEKSEVSLSA